MTPEERLNLTAYHDHFTRLLTRLRDTRAALTEIVRLAYRQGRTDG